MASKRIYVEHLKGIGLFSELSGKELEKVAMAGTEVHVADGTIVMKEGDVGHSAVIVLKGSAVVRRNGRKLRDIGPGEIAGEMALLDDAPRSATVQCTSDCSLLEITGGQFRAVMADVPTISRKVLATLAGRIRDLDRATFG